MAKNRLRGRGKTWIAEQKNARVRTYWNDQLKNYPGAILDFEGEGADHGPVLIVRDASRIRAKYDILGTVEAVGERFRINTAVRAFTFNTAKGLALGLAHQFVPGHAEAVQFVRLGGLEVTFVKVIQVLGRMPPPVGAPPVPPAAPAAPPVAPAAPSTPPASALGAIVGALGGRIITFFPPVPRSIIEPTPKEN